MAKHIQTGKLGEALALDFFVNKAYTILEKNWRYAHWEVDIIASKNDILHFIEIKTRRTKNYGLPEQQVGAKKMEHLVNAAEAYLHAHPKWKRIQFDILAISILKNEPVSFFFIEDIFT
jgi:putative endonuclease